MSIAHIVRRTAAVVGATAVAVGLATVPGGADAAPRLSAWGPCDDIHGASPRTQCATVAVPRDYAHPDGPTIDLTVSRLAATGAERGVLVGNPGGPGGDAIGMFTHLKTPAAISQEWDLVAVQPRGLVGGTPVECDEITASTDTSRGLGAVNRQRCEKNTPGYTKTLTTETNARDIEQVRRALGVEKISLYGLSYGTWLMSTYATLFPTHTDRLVLDSAMDPSHAWGVLADEQTPGYKKRTHALMAWIADHDDVYHLGDTPLKVYRRWSAQVESEAGVPSSLAAPPARVGDVPPGLQAVARAYIDGVNLTADVRARFENLVATLATGDVQATSSLLVQTRIAAPDRNSWPLVAQLMTGGLDVPKPTAEQLEAVTVSQNMQMLMFCNEDRAPHDPSLTPAAFVQNALIGDVFETFGLVYRSGMGCAGTAPVSPAVPVRNKGLAVKPLQIQSVGDPQTPYGSSQAMRRAMGAHLITVGGGDHGQFGRANPVVDDAVTTYLRTGRTGVTRAPQAPITTSLR